MIVFRSAVLSKTGSMQQFFPFEHELSCTIINYHQLSRSLDVLKFDMIADNSLFGLIGG